MFRKITLEDFGATLESKATPAFKEAYSRFIDFSDWIRQEAMVHTGDLTVEGDFKPPAFCTLIDGSLQVRGNCDLSGDFDWQGLFIVLGNVECRCFMGELGVQSFIDGDLSARDCIVNGFEDSSLSVMGTLRTKVFLGADIWAEVGAGAVMDYGEGYCLPIGWRDAERESISPIHGEAETLRLLAIPSEQEGYLYPGIETAEYIRSGKPIFKV